MPICMLTVVQYMSLYTVAYNYCTHPKGQSSDFGLLTARRAFLPRFQRDLVDLVLALASAYLMGLDIYNSLIRYFVCHLKLLRDVRDLSFVVVPT